MRAEQEKFHRLLEQMNAKRKSLEAVFETHMEHALSLIESIDKGQEKPAALQKTEKEFDVALANCDEIHYRVLELLNNENIEQEIEWIRNKAQRPKRLLTTKEKAKAHRSRTYCN